MNIFVERMYLILNKENFPVEIFSGVKSDAENRVKEINKITPTDKVHLFKNSLPAYKNDHVSYNDIVEEWGDDR